MLIRRWVAGAPKGQPRPRAFSRDGHARVYDPGTAEGWKGQVALAFRDAVPAQPIECALRLSIALLMPRPKTLMARKYPDCALNSIAKPDADNAAKAVMDALQAIGMFRDDAQVAELMVRKAYHPKSGAPGAWVEIEEIYEVGRAYELVSGIEPTIADALEVLDGEAVSVESGT